MSIAQLTMMARARARLEARESIRNLGVMVTAIGACMSKAGIAELKSMHQRLTKAADEQ